MGSIPAATVPLLLSKCVLVLIFKEMDVEFKLALAGTYLTKVCNKKFPNPFKTTKT